jgi:dihydrofolate reductase
MKQPIEKLSLIACISQNYVIGNDNKLIFNPPGDLKRFKEITIGNGKNAIVIGRKTFESLGEKPLKDRANIVVSSKYGSPGNVFNDKIIIVDSLDFLTDEYFLSAYDEIFIIGGGEIYKQTIHLCSKMYLTVVLADAVGDAYFPEFNNNDFVETFRENNYGNILKPEPFSFVNYKRK